MLVHMISKFNKGVINSGVETFVKVLVVFSDPPILVLEFLVKLTSNAS